MLPLDKFTKKLADSGKVLEWGKSDEVWDVASTGCVGNITPLVGFLWLMVKAILAKTRDEGQVFVPKISTRGTSCGMVDILEAGGLEFPTDPRVIKRECEKRNGIFCRQDPNLTPSDTRLMKARHATNSMKNVGLVYASILSKRIIMGCTHVIVDVKIGKDAKILAPWMPSDMIKELTGGGKDSEKLLPRVSGTFMTVLSNLGVGKLKRKQDDASYVNTDGDAGRFEWLEQTCDKALSPLKRVTWFFTNADMPQCRAIGRELILYHIDKYLGSGGNSWDLPKNQSTLFLKVLPLLCGIPASEATRERLAEEWVAIRLSMKNRINDFAASHYFEKQWLDRRGQFGGEIEVEGFHDLNVCTVGWSNRNCTVRRMNAYFLDGLFEWLGGAIDYDPEVGIVLHKLPTELIEKDKEFVTVFFRPSRTTCAEVVQRVQHFITNECAFEVTES